MTWDELTARLELPEPYYDEGDIKIYCGDCLEIMPALSTTKKNT